MNTFDINKIVRYYIMGKKVKQNKQKRIYAMWLNNIYSVFTMLGGLAVFMYGMKIMGDSLETIAGSRVKTMFAKVSNNNIKGVGIGMGVTALIQSSSATTVMLVGFVNVGFLSLNQATAIIMGSNIGTTITAQLSSMSGFQSFNITAIMSLIAGIGCILFMFSKNDTRKHLGLILLGLGMLFIGLQLMSSTMGSFAKNPDGTPTAFANFMLNSFTNPILNIIAGALFTAVIQSSSAATGVLLAFATANMLNFDTAMFMLLGTNIGTCVTAILSSVGTSVNAKRTATIHLLFNVIGTLIVMLPMMLFTKPISNFFMTMSGTTSRAIANFHTIFNILNTIILFPFINQLVTLSTWFVKDKKNVEQKTPKRLYYLDERLLHTPSLAVAQSLSEVKNMGDIANFNLQEAINMLTTGNGDKLTEMEHNEEILNYLNIEITNYLVKFSGLEMTKKDEIRIASLFHVIADIERVGDHAENIWKYASKMQKGEIMFSQDAIDEIKAVQETLSSMYIDTMNAFLKSNKLILAKIEKEEATVDEAKRMMEKMHIERLSQGNCTPEAGAIYLSLSSQLERVADHFTNIAYSFLPYKDKLAFGDIKKN